MIHTTWIPSTVPLVVQRVSGTNASDDVERGNTAAFALIGQVLAGHSSFDLLLDMRGMHFPDLGAHRAWRRDFLASPAVTGHVRRAAIVGSDTPAFRAEQQMLETERCRFFLDPADAYAWLGAAPPSQAGG